MRNSLRTRPIEATNQPAMRSQLDATDRRIIQLLVENGRMATCQVADSIGLSESTTSTRLRRLLHGGVISGIHAHIDPTVVGRCYHVTIGVRLASYISPTNFERTLMECGALIDAWQVTGNMDYQLRVACADMAELDWTLGWLRKVGAEETVTSFLLRQVSGTSDANLVEVRS